MVHLSPTPPPEPCHRGDALPERHVTSPKAGSPAEGAELAETNGETYEKTYEKTYAGYENYIENGLLCLKHKVRNLEKKKMKLDEYRLRLRRGELLNRDQMASVEKYEEVLHHLSLAQELHKTLDSLTQNLLRSQKKAVRKEQMLRSEEERRRLSSVLQLQKILQSLDLDRVRTDLLSGLNRAPKVQVQTLHRLDQLRPLLGLTRDYTLSLEEQMEQAAGLYLDLLDAKDESVVGSTFKELKEELDLLLESPYFRSLPLDPETPETSDSADSTDSTDPQGKASSSSSSDQSVSGPVLAPVSVQTWDSDFGALEDREPPEQWDSASGSPAVDERPNPGKPWRGGAALVPKNHQNHQNHQNPRRHGDGDGKRRKEKKIRREELNVDLQMDVLSLPSDPDLRRQRLEQLLNQTHGAFSFMQDSVLDGDSSPSRPPHRLRRRASGCPSPLAQCDVRSPCSSLVKTLHSTPLPARRLEPKLLSESSLELKDLQLPAEPQSPALVKPPPSPPPFTTPPSRRPLPSANFSALHTVFKVNPTLPPTDFCKAPQELGAGVSSISTQTPPEFAPPEDDMVYDYSSGSFLSPSQSGGRAAPSRRRVRGTPQSHPRDTGHFYTPRGESEQSFRGARARHDHSAAWSDSSLGHSPEPSAFVLDSGQGESLAVSTLHSSGLDDSSSSAPVLPHLPAPDAPLSAPVLPLPLYPVPAQPLRVAFSASRTANFAPGNLDQPIVFDQLHSNHGDVYDAHIGRFTCPAPGTYVFLFHILKLAINVPLYVNLMRNQEVMVSAYANDGAPDHETASNHAILPLYQGDQVWLRLHRGAIYGSTWKYSTFSGFLLYQD